jgi:NCS1 family nucleobase:cation symporter-1
MAATFPKYINLRRGAYITVLLSIACNPWKLVNTATTFLAVLSSYSVFLGPMIGSMTAAYFIVMQRKIKVEDLFPDRGDRSIYWYTYGVNWRAPVAVSVLLHKWARTIQLIRAVALWNYSFTPRVRGQCRS